MLPVRHGCFSRDGFEMAVEVGEVVEAAFITYFSDCFMGFGQEFTGVTDAHFHQEAGEGFLNA